MKNEKEEEDDDILAKPMGKQPRNRDCAGWEIMATHISG
jgi:hypothetical protein